MNDPLFVFILSWFVIMLKAKSLNTDNKVESFKAFYPQNSLWNAVTWFALEKKKLSFRISLKHSHAKIPK